MADNYPFDSSNVPYSAVFNQDYTADSAAAVSTEVVQTTAVSLITIEGGAGGTSGGVGGTGGSVTLLDSAYSSSRDKYSGGDGGTGGGALGNGAGGGGAAGYAGVGGNAGSGAAANSGGGGGGGASTNQLLLGGGGVGLFGKGTTGAAGTTSAAAGGGSPGGSDSAEGGFDGFFDSAGAQADFSPITDYSTIPVTAGLIVHLDAGVTASYSGSGSTWHDLTSNNNDFTLTNSPTYSSANGGKFQFNGSTQYAAGGPNLSTSDCTVISIHRYATNSNSARGRITAGNSNNWWVGNHGGNTSYYANGQISYTAGHDTNFHIYAATENFSADNRVFYNNNVAPSGQSPSAGSEGPNGIQLGRWGNGEYSDCEVAVILVYNRILIATELTAIFDFYKSRFGIS